MEQDKITICNYWGEPYPACFSTLIDKCDQTLSIIQKIFANKDCVLLDDLYKVNSQNNEIQRQRKVFEDNGYFPNAKLDKKTKTDNELKGLYVFAETSNSGETIPCYVGISGTIFRRLKQHGWYKLHNEATLAYMKASTIHSHIGERKDLEYPKIEEQQKFIRKYKVAIVPETIDFDLYFMEVYVSGKLKTLWNSFKTH